MKLYEASYFNHFEIAALFSSTGEQCTTLLVLRLDVTLPTKK